MAALPSPTQVAGSHVAIYEAYYNQVDPHGYGRIGALEAARFLKKSQLSDVILSKIWDMADPQSRGSLDKSGMFVALKLCAFAQLGHELSMANLSQDTAPPKMGELPKITQRPPVTAPPIINSVSSGDWSIKPNEKAKYDQLFDSLQPLNGYIPGNKVKGVLMDSKLPVDTLGKIWDLADMDKDGMLDRHEFVIAMHLVYKALEKYAIPSVLPPELISPGKRKPAPPIVGNSPAVQVPPIAVPPPVLPLSDMGNAVNSLIGIEPIKAVAVTPKWVVSAEDQAAADKLFLQADMDMDGFVSGSEIKDVFLQSRLPQGVLANIWSLCDICQSGKLNKEQFALSMWLIKQKMNHIDLPTSLTPEMMPPSLRKISDAIVENNNITGYSNPELDMISRDIVELARERRAMEQDIAQKEADIKIKNGEIKSLQSELDTLAATLKQLENQRGEAQKRLNDLKAQVEKLRQQAEEQESVLRVQEDELNSKRQELEGLRQEEQQLEQQQNKSREQLNELTKNLQNTQLQISQAKAKITHLEEQQRQMSDVIAIYDSALAAGDPNIVPDTSLQFNPEIEEFDNQEEKNSTTINCVVDRGDGFSNGTTANQSLAAKDDPFSSSKAKEAFGTSNDGDPFASAFDSQPSSAAIKDPFGDDPFANLHAPTRAESPSPALPPKKAKQPPPRPAPPRPASAPGGPGGPLRAAPAPPTPSPTPDPFGNANSDPFAAQVPTIDNANGNTFMTSSTTGFADFANFDSKPDLLPSRSSSVPPRLVTGGRPRVVTLTPTPASKLPDFTEDPFRDYRYEDPFTIADPFADDGIMMDDARNANTKNNDVKKLDPFGMETTDNRKDDNDAFSHSGFESNFETTTISKNRNINTSEIGYAFGETNSNVKYDQDFPDTFAVKGSTRAINFDEAFSMKTGKTSKRRGLDLTQAFEDKLSFGERKNKTNAWKNINSSVAVGENLSIEEQHLAWASEQSLKAEEKRRRIKEQEDAELALALELSKHENNEKC